MPSNDVFQALAQPPFRVIDVEGDFVFVEHAPSEEASTAELRRVASAAARIASSTSILLLASHYRLAAMVDLGVEGLVVQNLESIHTIGIPRELFLHLGRSTSPPGRDPKVRFAPNEVVEASAHELHGRLENLLLPWTGLAYLMATPSPGATPNLALPARARQAIQIRDRLLRDVKMVDAKKWALWRGLASSSNPSAALGKYKQAGRAFAVQDGRRDLYPAFQFAHDAEPLSGLATVLSQVPEDARGWPLLSWFEAENRLLGGKKPSELIESDPQKVADAAARFYSPNE